MRRSLTERCTERSRSEHKVHEGGNTLDEILCELCVLREKMFSIVSHRGHKVHEGGNTLEGILCDLCVLREKMFLAVSHREHKVHEEEI